MTEKEIKEMEEQPVGCYTCKYHGMYCANCYSEDECGEESGYPHWVSYLEE